MRAPPADTGHDGSAISAIVDIIDNATVWSADIESDVRVRVVMRDNECTSGAVRIATTPTPISWYQRQRGPANLPWQPLSPVDRELLPLATHDMAFRTALPRRRLARQPWLDGTADDLTDTFIAYTAYA